MKILLTIIWGITKDVIIAFVMFAVAIAGIFGMALFGSN